MLNSHSMSRNSPLLNIDQRVLPIHKPKRKPNRKLQVIDLRFPAVHLCHVKISNLTGWSVQEIERLRQEFLSYTNHYGVIDREGFRKLYLASLLNMTWEALERDSEAAFRNFDINLTGFLDFNEYITACSRMSRDINPSYGSSGMPPQGPAAPQMNPNPYTY
jgi:hypothetical protein